MSDDPFVDNLLDYAKDYVEAAGSSLDEVTIEKGYSPGSLLELAGYRCVQTERTEVGYEIFEFEDSAGEKVLMILDVISHHWAKVE